MGKCSRRPLFIGPFVRGQTSQEDRNILVLWVETLQFRVNEGTKKSEPPKTVLEGLLRLVRFGYM